MKMPLLAVLTLSLACSSVASAHTHLENSSPADGSTVASAPTQFVLTFGEAATLTALTIQKDGGVEQKITTLPKQAAANLAVQAPRLDNGHYVLKWRVVGKDGHVMSGKFGFTVGGKPGAATPAGSDHHH